MVSALRQVFTWVRSQPGVDLDLTSATAPPLATRAGATLIVLPGTVEEIPPHEILELLMMGAASVSLITTTELAPAHAKLCREVVAVGSDAIQIVDPERATVEPRDIVAADNVPVQRRDMFGIARRGAAVALPEETLFAEQRYAVAMQWLLDSLDETPQALAGFESDGVVLSAAGCVACGVCVTSCPTEALELTSLDTSPTTQISTLREYVDRCIGCLDCVALCPHSVLLVDRQATWPETLAPDSPAYPLITVPTRSCTKCRAMFPVRDGSDLCPTCRAQRANPFGVRWPKDVPMPPGLNLPTD